MRLSALFASTCVGLLCMQALAVASGPLTIRGHLQFPQRRVNLPPNSTYRVELRDVSRVGAPSKRHYVFVGSADKTAKGLPLDFQIVVPAKEELSQAPRTLALFAVVNVGWKQDDGEPNEWIRKGDFLSTVTHFIELPEGDSIDDFVLHLAQVYFLKEEVLQPAIGDEWRLVLQTDW
ncbi:hypothetical protein Esti_002387 [Eimeria stiedai]